VENEFCDIYVNAFLAGLKPEPKLTVSEWADEHRYLSTKASAEPGKYRTSRTPYLKQIMDDMSVSSPIKEIALMKGAQVGFTEAMNNFIGYVIDHAPGPMLLVNPTIDMAKRNSKMRIDPLIEECPRLRSKVKDRRSRDSSNTQQAKEFPGGILVITGANSPSSLCSMPVRFLLLDETDRYPRDAGGEGNPIDLAKARTRTFARRKIVEGSTPTIHGQSNIEAVFDISDKHFCYVPCPHCSHMQTLVWEQVKWDEGKPETARYECVECHRSIENWQKTWMLDRHEWRPENPGAEVRGYFLNALYSPVGWYSWADAAKEFVEANKKGTEALKTFVNTVLAQTWKEKTEKPDWNRLYERREAYPFNIIPPGGRFLTAGVDVQADRIETVIVAWGRDKVSWAIDHRVIHGDPSKELTWSELDKILQETWPVTGRPGVHLPIKIMAVDSGYATQHVYNWVRRYSPNRVIAVKGSDHASTIIARPAAVDITVAGKQIRKGVKVWTIGVSLVKSELYGFLRLNKAIDGQDDEPGYCHFPEFGEEFFKQLCAEELVVKYVKGYKKFEWQKTRDRNEALDLWTYSRAAAAVCGIDRFTESHWAAIEKEIGSIQPAGIKILSDQPKAKNRKRESSWL
jgi:phage terminase large subunit GpA-like protein